MFRKFVLLLLLAITSSSMAYSQTDNEGFELFPSGLNFMPLKANIQEARMGVLYFPDNGNLKVDVGNSIDLLKFNFAEEKCHVTLGVDFFAFAWSTSYGGKRLQIDALDGFFGGNVSFSKDYGESKLISRLRIIHNSAHLVDGHWVNNAWVNGDKPIPYTRDFGELTVGYRTYESFGSMMGYGAVAYSTLVRPSDMKKWTGFAGGEIVFDDLIGKVFDKKANLYLTYQITASTTPDYTFDNHIIAGIKLGEWEEKGIALYVDYYNGRNFFSEFFTDRIEKIGIGFQVDFF